MQRCPTWVDLHAPLTYSRTTDWVRARQHSLFTRDQVRLCAGGLWRCWTSSSCQPFSEELFVPLNSCFTCSLFSFYIYTDQAPGSPQEVGGAMATYFCGFPLDFNSCTFLLCVLWNLWRRCSIKYVWTPCHLCVSCLCRQTSARLRESPLKERKKIKKYGYK